MSVDDGDLLRDHSAYQRLVGNLIYFTCTVRYIICSKHCKPVYLCSSDESSGCILWKSLTISRQGISYSNHGHINVETYQDANWAGSKSGGKSTTRYCTSFGDNLIL
eukprot:TRINITY_DN11828_c3_g1_i1.p1 TRINITY_DN11828_c3_g1~~TRINITY_DN11828_c3_g1_i1.p1  ORF type:complete len:107 (+),score=11.35 TRINITY_DN11828_c3_g1_i1:756-1076(+)